MKYLVWARLKESPTIARHYFTFDDKDDALIQIHCIMINDRFDSAYIDEVFS